jgi:hypothetical protein
VDHWHNDSHRSFVQEAADEGVVVASDTRHRRGGTARGDGHQGRDGAIRTEGAMLGVEHDEVDAGGGQQLGGNG